jgi:hypothetical protein
MIVALTTTWFLAHEVGLAQHLQMFRHRGAPDLEPCARSLTARGPSRNRMRISRRTELARAEKTSTSGMSALRFQERIAVPVEVLEHGL